MGPAPNRFCAGEALPAQLRVALSDALVQRSARQLVDELLRGWGRGCAGAGLFGHGCSVTCLLLGLADGCQTCMETALVVEGSAAVKLLQPLNRVPRSEPGGQAGTEPLDGYASLKHAARQLGALRADGPQARAAGSALGTAAG